MSILFAQNCLYERIFNFFMYFSCLFLIFFFFFILIYTKSYGFRIERILHLYGIPNNAETYNERKQWRLGEFSI